MARININISRNKPILAAAVFFFATNILDIDYASAQVLEQLDNGEVALFAGGELMEAPRWREGQQHVDEGFGTQYQPSPSPTADSVVFDMPPSPKTRPFAANNELRPKTSRLLTNEQLLMRRMAQTVALSFADHRAVVRAQLESHEFVALFTAMIKHESNFNSRAVSHKGAAGLGQLMPATARELGVCDVFSPNENLIGAATYLTNMLERFGSPVLALAAYNAGPAAVAQYRDVPPYPETQRYVAKILLSAARQAGEAQDLQTATNTIGYPSSSPVAAVAVKIDTASFDGSRELPCKNQRMQIN